MDSPYDPELELLGEDTPEEDSTGALHASRTAPIFTGDAFAVLGPSILPQRASYGRIIAQSAQGFPDRTHSSKLYINTNAPFSALVCGVQGSGKSHSTSVLLESCLMSDPRLGTLPAPLSAIVFHFDTAAGGGAVQPCEAAYLASLDAQRGGGATPPSVTVLVLPANLHSMKQVYGRLPSVRVEALHFSAEDISGERLLAMMKVDENSQMPLYMEAIMSILRSLESKFSYAAFRDELKKQKFSAQQKSMLNLRLSLLDSCLEGGNAINRVATHFRQGQLTIIDLSSPFMDGSSACGFFDLILGLFVEADINTAGKLVVLDEAHKYLSESQSGTSARLTESLLSIIRQQRHLATRVVISTQEPTVVPSKFLDLCSFIIAHRFSSPKWLRLLSNHVSAAEKEFDDLFSKIVSLRTGQAIMFAPNGLGVRESAWARATPSSEDSGRGSSAGHHDVGAVAPFGQGYLHVQSRLRITRDGGHSILAVSDPNSTTRIGRVPEPLKRAAPVGVGMHSQWSADPDAHWGAHENSSDEPTAELRAAPLPDGGKGKAPAEPYAGWGGGAAAQATSSAWAGGASAPAEDPAEASASPEPRSVEAGAVTEAARADRPSGSLSATSAAPVIDLTGELVLYKPLIDFLLTRKTTTERCVTVQTISTSFRTFQPDTYGDDVDRIVSEAVSRGLLLQSTSTQDTPVVQLIPGATYITDMPTYTPAHPASAPATSMPPVQTLPAAILLRGRHAAYAPLIRYLSIQRLSGFSEITQATVLRKLGYDYGPVISGAKELGMIQNVQSAGKPKIMLAPGATFQF